MNLVKRTIVGGLWLSIFSWLGFLGAFTGRAILARLITPNDFGIFALVLSVIEIISLFFFFSFPMAAISLQEEKEIFDTVMWFAIVGGVLIGIIGSICGWIYVRLGKPLIGKIIFLLSNIQILYLTSQVYFAYKEKDVFYKYISLIKGIARPLGFLIAIICVIWFHVGIWGLVIVEVVANLVLFFGQKKVSGYRFRGKFDKTTAKKVWSYSYKMFFNNMLEMMYVKTPLFVIGNFAGTRFLGFFEQAYYLTRLPNTFITSILARLNFVVFSKVQKQEKKLQEVFCLSNFIIFRIFIPLTLLLFLFPRYIIKILFGMQWLASASLAGKFSFMILFYPLFNIAKSFYYARKKLKTTLWSFFYANLVLYSLILVMLLKNLQDYLPYAFSVSILVGLLFLYRTAKREGFSLKLKENFLYPSLLFILLLPIGSWLKKRIENPFLVGGIIIGSYFLFLFLKEFLEIKKMIKTFIRNG